MCCSYYMEESSATKPYIDMAYRNPLREKTVSKLARPFITSGEVKPRDITVAIALTHKGKRSAFPMVWGFTGNESYVLSVKTETIEQNPTFNESWERRRCVIPASWYFDNSQTIYPDGTRTNNDEQYIFQTEGSSFTLLAGIYHIEEEHGIKVPHFALLTKTAGEQTRRIHDRMPVILDSVTAASWLQPDQKQETLKEIAASSVTNLIVEKGEPYGSHI